MSARETTRAATRAARARRAPVAAAVAVAAGWAAPALACPVCYGEASGGVIDGTKLSVAFLGGLVYLLLFGGVGMAVMVRRRALRTMDPRHGLRLIDGMAPDGMGEDGMDEEQAAVDDTAANDTAVDNTAVDNTAGPHPAAPEETSER